MVTEIEFWGILSDVDFTITKLELDHGFEIKRMDFLEIIKFLETLRGIEVIPESSSITSVYKEVIMNDLFKINRQMFSDDFYYLIYNSFENEEEVMEFDSKYVEGYIKTLLRKIRLYSGSNVHLPLKYFYSNQKKQLISSGCDLNYYHKNILTLTDEDTINLKSFIKNIDFPFEENLLNLAFSNYEQSFITLDYKLAFLTLMNGIEILLSPTNGRELNYKISRNLAVLLGETVEDAEDKFKEMKDLYSKRSKIVHNGNEDVTESELKNLQEYLRFSIIEFQKIIRNKDDLFEKDKLNLKRLQNITNLKDKILYMLNCMGFGERKWLD